jgi:phosphomannomutase/phosphomannomutase/phosphoglucomutase
MRSDGSHLECFKAYDIRGKVPGELDAGLVELIGWSYARLIRPRRVAVGRDARLTGPELTTALCRGLTSGGVDVVDIGLVGTEEVYFATFSLGLDGGVEVTASHNPRDYNGLKFTRDLAKPISGDTGLLEMEQTVLGALHGGETPTPALRTGTITPTETRQAYVDHLLTYVDVPTLRPLKIVVNAGNGCAGQVVDMLEERLPFQLVKLNNKPDGSFPSGVPNPMLPENRSATAKAVVSEKADLGIAWDGDFDRCFFFDERGTFIEGYYLVGLLAERALRRHPGGSIIHDPRLVWNTEEMVRAAGGVPVLCKSGHAFIKEKMRAADAVYGGEMSAHHYFKEFSYCDSGMIPWLQVAEAMSERGRPFSAMVEERMARYPVSGEINLTLERPAGALTEARRRYEPDAVSIDSTDGLSFEFPLWRFNVRLSNTEPVVRLNVEARADEELLQAKTQEVIDLLKGVG